jgi:hypothetical protein
MTKFDNYSPLPAPKEPNEVQNEDLGLLRTLLEILELGGVAKVSNSPFSSISPLLGDLFLLFSSKIFGRVGQKTNKGLKFLDDFHRSEEDIAAEGLLTGTRPVGWFGETKQDAKGKEYMEYYFPARDPLGNPLQVEIPYPDSLSFTDRDKKMLSRFFEKLAEVFYELGTGHIDWSFLRQINALFQPSGTCSKRSKSSTEVHKNIKISNNEYFKRRRTKRAQKKKKLK